MHGTMSNTNSTSSNNKLLVVAGKAVASDEEFLTDALVWENLCFVDQVVTTKNVYNKPNAVTLMAMAARAYYKLYPDKTPADLEREFRGRDFNSGLIAKAWRDEDPRVSELVDTGKVVVANLANYNTNSIESLEYYVIYSCRPREFAEKELLEHVPGGPEENLSRLERAGDLNFECASHTFRVEVEEAEEKISEEHVEAGEILSVTMTVLETDEREFLDKLQLGKIRLCFQTVCMETKWHEAEQAHPDAKAQLIGIDTATGQAISVLMDDDGTIACPFARTGGPCQIPAAPYQYFPFSIRQG